MQIWMGCNGEEGTQVCCMGEQGTEAGKHASQAPADKLKSSRQTACWSAGYGDRRLLYQNSGDWYND